MASSYPGSLDSFDTIASDKKTSDAVGGRTHRQMHNDVADAVEAVQAEHGTDPAGTFATVKARLDALVAYAAKTGAYTATVADHTLNVTSGTFTLDLPAASTCTGQSLRVKNSGTGVVTLDGNSSETVEGVATLPLGPGSYVEITSTGAAWILTAGLPDTGWRNVAASIDADWEPRSGGGSLLLRRVGKNVYLTGDLDRVTGSGSRANADTVYTAPTGFRPTTGYLYVPLGTAYSGSVNANGLVNNLNSTTQIAVTFLSGGTYGASEDVSFTSGWITTDDWPTSLPGSTA